MTLLSGWALAREEAVEVVGGWGLMCTVLGVVLLILPVSLILCGDCMIPMLQHGISALRSPSIPVFLLP